MYLLVIATAIYNHDWRETRNPKFLAEGEFNKKRVVLPYILYMNVYIPKKGFRWVPPSYDTIFSPVSATIIVTRLSRTTFSISSACLEIGRTLGWFFGCGQLRRLVCFSKFPHAPLRFGTTSVIIDECILKRTISRKLNSWRAERNEQ